MCQECLGMSKDDQRCAKLFSQFELIQTHTLGMLQLVGTRGCHGRLVRRCRTRMGTKLPAGTRAFSPF